MDKGKKVSIIVFVGIILTLFVVLIINALNIKEYSKNFFYMDTYINVSLYVSNEAKANRAFKEIENIYKTYDELTNKYSEAEYGLYNLNHGSNEIDYRLYKIIEKGYLWHQKSDGLFNIAIGNVTDIWKKYREAENGVPTLDELKNVSISMGDVLINETRRNKPNEI